MISSIILSRELLPELVDYRCMRCGSLFFKANKELLVVWMGSTYPPREIPIGMGFIEHKCRGCSHIYKIYFQA